MNSAVVLPPEPEPCVVYVPIDWHVVYPPVGIGMQRHRFAGSKTLKNGMNVLMYEVDGNE